jgi:lipooligosaccharide transport system ATP-binding protein
MDEAERLATRLAVIDHGVMIASDTPRALLAEARRARGRRGVRRRSEGVGGHPRPAAVDAARDLRGDRVRLRERSAADARRSRDALGVRYLHRPANLEDLFIKLTGRELRD